MSRISLAVLISKVKALKSRPTSWFRVVLKRGGSSEFTVMGMPALYKECCWLDRPFEVDVQFSFWDGGDVAFDRGERFHAAVCFS